MLEAMSKILGRTEDEIRAAVDKRKVELRKDSEDIPFVVDGISSDDPRFVDILTKYGETIMLQ